MIWKLSLRTRISAALFLTALVGILLLGGYGFYTTRKAAEENVEQPIIAENALTAHHTEMLLDEIVDDVRVLAEGEIVHSLLAADDAGGIDPEYHDQLQSWKHRLADEFKNVMRAAPRYIQMRYINEIGREVVRVNKFNGPLRVVPPKELQDKSDRYYFREVMKLPAGAVYVSGVDLDQEHGRTVVPYRRVVRVAIPLSGARGERRGLIIANADAQTLLHRQNLLRVAKGQVAFVADQDGYYIHHTDESKEFGGTAEPNAGQNVRRDYPVVKLEVGEGYRRGSAADILSGKPGHGYTPSDSVIFYQPILSSGTPRRFWVIGRVFPQRALFAPLRRWEIAGGLVAVVALGFASLLGAILVRRTVGPLGNLAEATRSLQRGDLSTRVPVGTEDEVGALARAFNDMAERIQDSHNTLEQRVEERTQELRVRTEEVQALYERSRLQVAEIEHIQQSAGDFVADLGVPELMHRVLRHSLKITGAAVGYVALIDPETETVEVVAVEMGGEECQVDPSLPLLQQGLVGQMVREAVPVMTNDWINDPRRGTLPHGHTHVESYLGIPLVYKGKVTGAIALGNKPGGFVQEDITRLSVFANHAAMIYEHSKLYDQVKSQRVEEQAALLRLSQSLISTLNPQEMMERTLDVVADVTEADGPLAVLLPDADNEWLVATAARGWAETLVGQRTDPMSGDAPPVVAMRTRQPLTVGDAHEEGTQFTVPEFVRARGVRSVAVVPLMAGDEAIGVLLANSNTPHKFSQDDVRLLSLAGSQLAMALRNARLFEETRRRNEELAALNAVAATLAGSLDLPTTLQQVLDQVMTIPLLRLRGGGVISLLDGEKQELEVVAHHSVPEGWPCGQQRVRVGECLCGKVAETGETLVCLNGKEDPRHNRKWEQMPDDGEVCVALKARGRVVGVMVCHLPRGYQPTEPEVRLLESIAAQMGVAIDNVRLFEAQSRLARILEATTDFVAMGDTQGVPFYFNRAARSWLGMKEDEPPSARTVSGAHPQWAARMVLEEGLPTAAREGVWTGETPFLSADGREVPTLQMILAHKNAKGEVEYYSTIAHDITERKRAEEALRMSQKSLVNAQRIAHLGNWDWDIVTNELHWSDEIYRIFGLEPQEFGATYPAFLKTVHPDDRELVERSVEAALRREQDYSIDHRIVVPGGLERFVHEQGEVTFNESGEPVRMTGTVQDITDRKRAEQEVARRQRELTALHETGMALGSTLDLDGILATVLEHVLQLCDTDRATVLLLDTETQELSTVASRERPGLSATLMLHNDDGAELASVASRSAKGPQAASLKLKVGQGAAGWVAQHRQPLFIPNVQEDERFIFRRDLRMEGVVSYLGLPLVTKGKLVGVLNLTARNRQQFDEEQVEFLLTLCGTAAVAIENARLYEAATYRAAQLAELQRASVAMSRETDVQTILSAACRSALALTNGQLAVIKRYDPETATAAFVALEAAPGFPLECDLSARPFPAEANSFLADILAGATVRVRDLAADPRFSNVPAGHLPLRELLGVPLYSRTREVMGALCVSHTEGEQSFTAGDEEMLSLLASHAAPILDNAQIRLEIQQRAEDLAGEIAVQKQYAENVISSIADGVYTVDEHNRVVSWNRGAEAITGWKAEEVVGKPCSDFLKHVDAEGNQLCFTDGCPFAVIRSTRQVVPSREVYGLHKDGHRVAMAVSAAPLFDDKREMVGAVEVFRDVSKERELMDSIQRANRAKSDFLANMSHEIRTPMNAILGFAQLMQRDRALTQRQQEHVAAINRSGEHLLALINDILEVSKIEAGRVTLSPTAFDLHGLLADLEMTFRVRADAKGLRLLTEIGPQVPRYVVTDESKLRQVFINLLGNAVKFTEHGGIALRVRADERAESGWRLVAEVQDTGPGIAEAELGSLFQPFQQAESGVRSGGTGLGLAISREFVRLMGGSISLSTEVGKGSTFRFEVRVEEGRAEETQDRAAQRQVLHLQPGQKSFRLLVVDDRDENRALLREMLQAVGFETLEAGDGEQALAEFEENSPAAILMDMRMPGMHGYEATRRIKATERGRQTPIIAVTATAFEDARQEVMDTGVDAYLRKPFKAHELFQVLAQCLGVQYVYDREAAPPVAAPRQPDTLERTRESLAALPAELTTQMRQATLRADRDRLLELVAEVESLDSTAAFGLRDLAERYEYEKLLDLLER